jgi:hypothetical protein
MMCEVPAFHSDTNGEKFENRLRRRGLTAWHFPAKVAAFARHRAEPIPEKEGKP